VEVDFVIDTVSHSLPVEVKYKKEVRTSDMRGIKKFLELYRGGERGYVINLGEIDTASAIQKKDCFTLGDIVF
jgi:predicted AAA+ superfamily ATPase